MPRYIIHHGGAYNYYTTVSDGACYEAALTLHDVEDITLAESGAFGLGGLSERLKRAHETGCSRSDWTLDDCIMGNKNGPNETSLSREEFIKQYLTLSDEQKEWVAKNPPTARVPNIDSGKLAEKLRLIAKYEQDPSAAGNPQFDVEDAHRAGYFHGRTTLASELLKEFFDEG